MSAPALWWVEIVVREDKPRARPETVCYGVLAATAEEAIRLARFQQTYGLDEYEAQIIGIFAEPHGGPVISAGRRRGASTRAMEAGR